MSSSFLIALVLPILIVVLALLLASRVGAIRRLYRAEVEAGLSSSRIRAGTTASTTTTRLPEPVQRYLEYTGADRAGPVTSFRAVFDGRMRRGPDQPWFSIHAEQYNFLDDFLRTFFIRGRMFGLPVVGRDLYAGGRGQMLIRALAFIPVADDTSPEMARSGLVTLFNDMCVLAPGALVDQRIEWSAVDDRTAMGMLHDGDLRVSATLQFGPAGELVDFVTHDRYTEKDGEHIAPPWSTPLSDYREFGGLRVASRGAASWQMNDGEFTYAEFVLKHLAINPEKFELG